MPAEWKSHTLRDAGVSLIDCEHRTPPAATTGFPYIAIPQLKAGRLDLSGARQISPENFREWTRKALPQTHDVILSRRCNPGETALVPDGLQCALGQNLVLLRADGTKIYPPFLRWLVRGNEWWEQIRAFLNVGAVFDSLKCADIPNFRLPIPPLEDQKAIASILGALDDKIELNRRTNDTLEAIARAIFKECFHDKVATSVQTGHSFDEVASASRESVNPLQYPEELFQHYSIPAYDERQLPAIEKGREIKSNKFVVYADSVLLSKLNPRIPRISLPSVVAVMQSVCSTEFLVLRPLQGWSREFVYGLCNSITFQSAFSGMVTGTSGSHQRVMAEHLGHLLVQLPPRELVAKFTQITRPIHAKAALNLRKNATLESLRDVLLPKLMSGEIRASNLSQTDLSAKVASAVLRKPPESVIFGQQQQRRSKNK